jgi:hypothetical protein
MLVISDITVLLDLNSHYYVLQVLIVMLKCLHLALPAPMVILVVLQALLPNVMLAIIVLMITKYLVALVHSLQLMVLAQTLPVQNALEAIHVRFLDWLYQQLNAKQAFTVQVEQLHQDQMVFLKEEVCVPLVNTVLLALQLLLYVQRVAIAKIMPSLTHQLIVKLDIIVLQVHMFKTKSYAQLDHIAKLVLVYLHNVQQGCTQLVKVLLA